MTQGKKQKQPRGTKRLTLTRWNVARDARARKRLSSMCPEVAWELGGRNRYAFVPLFFEKNSEK